MLFCTVAQPKQLAAALILARSIKEHHPDAKMAVCFTSEKVPPTAIHSDYFDHVISAQDFQKGFFMSRIQKVNSSVEKSRIIKAPFLNYLIKHFSNEETFIYLDCYTQVFGPFNELLSSLDHHSIIYSIYCLEPPSENQVLNEFELLKNGNINGGFFAFRKTEESIHFINRFYDLVKKDLKNKKRKQIKGLLIDEKWLCLMIGLFDIYIFRHPSYHISVWNLHESERELEMTSEGDWKIKGNPIKSMFFADLHGSLDWSLDENKVNFFQEKYRTLLADVVSSS